MKDTNKLTHIQVRVSQWEKNRIKGLAKLYAGDNVSLWILHHAINGERRKLKKPPEESRKAHTRRRKKASMAGPG